MAQRVLVAFLALAAVVCAQRRVDPRFSYVRVIAVVPFVGQGTPADPKRPEYAPWPVSQDHSGILAYYHEPSDDGRFALVEYVAYNRSALQAILNDTSIAVFIKGVASKSAIETALKQYRKDFDLDKFGVVMP